MSLSIVMQNMINAILDDIESCAILVGSYRHKCFDKPSPLKLLCSFPINDKIVESRRIFTRFNLNSSRKTIIKILNFRQSAHPLYSPTLLPGDPFQPENLLNSPPNLVQFASIFFFLFYENFKRAPSLLQPVIFCRIESHRQKNQKNTVNTVNSTRRARGESP